MQEENKNIEELPKEESNKKQAKKKRSLPVSIIIWALRLVLLIIFLITAVIIFIITPFGKNWALHFGIDKYNESLVEKDSKIYAESIEGTILDGLVLNNVNLVVKGDTLLKAPRLEAGYNPFRFLFDKEIYVSKVILDRPEINITKVSDKDSTFWNFEYFLSSDAPEEIDTSTEKFDLKIIVDELKLNGANFRILENKNSNLPIRQIPMPQLDSLDLSNLDVTDFNLDLKAKYFEDFKEVDIKKISFNTNSELDVKNISFYTKMPEDSNYELNNFNFTTNRSKVDIAKLSVDDFDIFDSLAYEDFRNKYVTLDIVTDKFDMRDLQFFIPSLDIFGIAYVDLKVKGNYGSVGVDTLVLKTDRSVFNFSGRVDSLNNPDFLAFDIVGRNIDADPHETSIILPGYGIPDYGYLGRVQIPYITYKGLATRFDSEFEVITSAGNAKGNVFLDAESPELGYKGNIRTQNVDIGKIIKDNSLASNLTGDFNFSGYGTDLRTMNAKLNYEMHGSRFYGLNINSSRGQVNVARGGAVLDVFYSGSGGTAQVAGTVGNLTNPTSLNYNLKGYTKRLDLSVFTKDQGSKSNLNFAFDVRGAGTDPDAIRGNFKLNLAPSFFATYKIPQSQILASIRDSSGGKRIELYSPFVDIQAGGKFTIQSLQNVVMANIDVITNKFTAEYNAEGDSNLIASDSVILVPPKDETKNYNITSAAYKDLDFSYMINLKDFRPIAEFAGQDSLDFKATINGQITNSGNTFTLKNFSDIREFSYGDSITSERFTSDINITNDLSAVGFSALNGSFDLRTDRLMYGSDNFDSVLVDLDFGNQGSGFLISGRQDTTIMLYTKGTIDLYSNLIRTQIDTLGFKYETYNVNNYNPLVIRYVNNPAEQFVNFDEFVLQSSDLRADLKGKFSLNGNSDVEFLTRNIKFETLQRMQDSSVAAEDIIGGGIRRLFVNFQGNLDTPNVTVELNTDPIRIENRGIGRLDAILNYKDDILTPNVSFYNPNNRGNFKVNGTIPYANPLNTDSTNRIEKIADESVDLNVEANNFQIAILQAILPNISALRGLLNGKISVKGEALQPQLSGNMKLSKSDFILDITGVRYGLDADMNTEGQKLVLSSSKLYTPDEDSRFISTTGYVDFTDLSLKEILLEMRGDVKVFDEDVTQNTLDIYGDLYVGSGSNVLNIKGDSKQLLLSGDLMLKRGQIIVPPLQASAYSLADDGFIYRVEIDSTSPAYDSLAKQMERIREYVRGKDEDKLTPFERAIVTADSLLRQKDEAGIFVYDIHVISERDIKVNVEVEPRTKQQFVGEASIDLYVDNKEDPNKIQGRGTVELSDDSYYRFFSKRFNTTGRLVFAGDITNPRLEIDGNYTTRPTGSNSNYSEVRVDLTIRGDAQNPDLKFTLYQDGVASTSSDAEGDAIAYILTGRSKDELSYGDRNALASSIGSTVGSSYASDFVGGAVSDVLPFITSTELSYQETGSGNVVQRTDVRFTAEFGDAVIRFGGQIFQDLNNTNVSVEYPLNKLLNIESLSNNLILQLERVTDPFVSSSQSDINSVRTGAIIYYRIRF